MSNAPQMAEVAALVGDPAREYSVRVARRARAHGDRARICRRRIAPNDEWSPRQIAFGETPPIGEAGSSSLLPAGGLACRANARKHHERRAGRAPAFPAEVQVGRKATVCSHLLNAGTATRGA